MEETKDSKVNEGVKPSENFIYLSMSPSHADI
jgi:hypothetical protein